MLTVGLPMFAIEHTSADTVFSIIVTYTLKQACRNDSRIAMNITSIRQILKDSLQSNKSVFAPPINPYWPKAIATKRSMGLNGSELDAQRLPYRDKQHKTLGEHQNNTRHWPTVKMLAVQSAR